MKRVLLVAVVSAWMLGPAQAAGQATEPGAVFQAVPADAWGMIAVRSLAELDQQLTNLGQATNSPMVGMSALIMAKGMLGLFAGVDDNGGAAVVIMPLESPEDLGKHFAVFVPTNNYEALLGGMQPEDLGGGVSKVLFQQKESYVARKGDFAVLCPTAEALKAVMQGQGSVTTNMTKHQITRLGKDHVVAWVNAAAVTASPLFADAARGLQGLGIDPESIKQTRSAQVSLHLSPEGIGLGLYVDAKPGTPLAKLTAGLEPPTRPLLTGLPAEGYVFASGGASTSGPELGDIFSGAINKAVGSVGETAPALKETAAKLADTATKLLGQIRAMGLAVNRLPPGSDGLAAATMVVGLDGGSAEFLASVSQAVADLKAGAPQEQADKFDALSYQAKAGGEKCDHLTIDLAALGLDEEGLAVATQLLGTEGLLFRLCAVDDKQVAVTLGGGAAHMETVVELTKGNRAPLADQPGIKEMASRLPPDRVKEQFIAPNAALELALALTKMFGGPELPFKLPPVQTPIAACSRCTPGGGVQWDALIPTELLKAMGQMAPGMGPPPGGPGGPPM